MLRAVEAQGKDAERTKVEELPFALLLTFGDTAIGQEFLQRLIRHGSHNKLPVQQERGHRLYPHPVGALPVRIHNVFERSLFEDLSSLLYGQTQRTGKGQEFRALSDVPAFGKISPEHGIVIRLASALGLGPFAKLLSEPAVVGLVSGAKGQPFLSRRQQQSSLYAFQVDTTFEKLLQCHSLFRGLGMKGKGHP